MRDIISGLICLQSLSTNFVRLRSFLWWHRWRKLNSRDFRHDGKLHSTCPSPRSSTEAPSNNHTVSCPHRSSALLLQQWLPFETAFPLCFPSVVAVIGEQPSQHRTRARASRSLATRSGPNLPRWPSSTRLLISPRACLPFQSNPSSWLLLLKVRCSHLKLAVARQAPVLDDIVLLAVGCWLLAVGCWLLAVGCWLLAVGRADFGRLFSVYCLVHS